MHNAKHIIIISFFFSRVFSSVLQKYTRVSTNIRRTLCDCFLHNIVKSFLFRSKVPEGGPVLNKDLEKIL